MIVLLHVIAAMGSLLSATLALLMPSPLRLRVTYSTTALTVLSGTYLAVRTPAHFWQTCVTGLVYVSAVGVLTAGAWWRLAKSERQL